MPNKKIVVPKDTNDPKAITAISRCIETVFESTFEQAQRLGIALPPYQPEFDHWQLDNANNWNLYVESYKNYKVYQVCYRYDSKPLELFVKWICWRHEWKTLDQFKKGQV
jgi:hypothetical protein